MIMKLLGILFLLQIFTIEIFGAVRNAVKNLPNVCVKENLDIGAEAFIKTTATGFKDLVEHSTIFVDKTLLLKPILDKKSLISITYPRKWGKTVNLDMLKTFVEIETDSEGNAKSLNQSWSYEFFKNGKIKRNKVGGDNLRNPPLISQHDKLLDKYLGKYPVIYIDISSIKPVLSGFYAFFDAFEKTIGSVFKKHSYLVRAFEKREQSSHRDMFNQVMDMKNNLEKFVDKPESIHDGKGVLKAFHKTIGSILEKPNNVFDVLQKSINNVNNISRDQIMRMKVDIEKFNKYSSGQGNTYEDMVDSVKFLSRLLNEHFDQRVFIIINDYDAVSRRLNFETPFHTSTEEAQKIENFYAYFVARMLEGNPYLHKGVISGVFNFVACFPQLASHHVNYNMLSKNMYPFYGFTKTEVVQLFIHAAMGDMVDEAAEWYNGYGMSDFPNITLFNPWSVVNLINNKKIEAYWRRTGKFNVFPEISHHKDIRTMFEAVISESAEAKIHRSDLSFNRKDIATLKRLISNDSALEINDYAVNLMLSYFYTTGYLSMSNTSVISEWKTDIRIKIPNKEIEGEIIHEFITIYRNVVGGVVARNVEHASNSLVELIEADGKLEFASSEFRNDLITLHKRLLPVPEVPEKMNSTDREQIHSAHFLMLLYVKLNHHYDIGFNVLYYEGKIRKRKPYMVLCGKNRGVLMEFNSSKEFSWWMARLTGAIRKALNRGEEYLNYFLTKNVKTVQIMEIFIPYNHEEVYMAFDLHRL